MKHIISNSALRLRIVGIAALFLAVPFGRAAERVVAWGDNSFGQASLPPSLTNVVAISAGEQHSLALRADGTVIAWGNNNYGQTVVPDGLSDVVAIDAGNYHNVVLKSDGTVAAWGQNHVGQSTVPAGLSDVKTIAAGSSHSMALKRNGTLVVWGNNSFGEISGAVDLTDISAIAAGSQHCLALRGDGTVVAWGINNHAQIVVPAGLRDVVGIAAGAAHNLALRQDGTLVVWGWNDHGESTVPADLTNAVVLGGGYSHSLALQADGQVAAWGENSSQQSTVPDGLGQIVAIAAGGFHNLALWGSGKPAILEQPTGRRTYTGTRVILRVAALGQQPLSYRWRKNSVDLTMETNSVLTFNSAQLLDSGGYAVVVSNSFGAITSQVAQLTVVIFGTPDIRSDGQTLTGDVTRGDQSTISLSTVFPNGTVFYTTDGSDPSFASQGYQAPFVITHSTMIRAIAYSADFTESVEAGPFQVQILPTYQVTKSVMGQGAVGAAPNLARYFPQMSVMLTAYPASGWRFVRWEGDACGSSSVTTVVMDANKSVTAVFEAIPSYPLAVTTVGGTILGPGAGPHPEGTVVNLTAQPSPGWQFMRWQGDAGATTPDLALTMDRAKSVQAVFGTMVSTAVGGSGNLTLIPPDGPYPYGSTVRIAARPNVGHYFATWGNAAGGRANPLEFVVTNANPAVSALFVPMQPGDVNIYADADGQGTVAVSPNLPWYSPGSSVTLTATPAPGWHFVRWQGEAIGTSPNANVVLNVSKTVTAVFEVLSRYTLGATTLGGGTISGNTDASYPQGAVVSLTAHPAPGWQFLHWVGSLSGTATNLAVTLERNSYVEAVFGTMLASNTVGPGTVGIDPGQGPYRYGSTVRFTATPNAGASFVLWGNAASGSQNPLDFVVTTANPAICALFTPGENTAPPSITAHPLSQAVVAGSNVTLRVTVSGASPFTFQWRKGGTAIPGATASSFTIFGASPDDAGAFDVVVSNPHGSIISGVANLTVVFPPSIAGQPVSQVVVSGNPVTLSVVAGGTEPFTYQWANTAGPIPGATSSSLTFNPADTNHTGNYVVLVSNAYGAVTSQVVSVTVFIPVTITAQPAQQVVPLRGTATFSATAAGHPAPSYQWLFNGQPLAGANASSLALTNVGTNMLGGYSMIAWHAYSAATSSPAMLLMSPSIRSPFLGATVIWGKSATLSASAVGSGQLSYQWFKDGVAIPFASNPTLVIPTVQLTDGGLYSLVVRSIWGSVTNAAAQVVVNPANTSIAMYAGVSIDGVAGFTYGIQYTTDLRDTNSWVNATNLTLEVPIQTWIDFGSATNARRFYRVIAR